MSKWAAESDEESDNEEEQTPISPTVASVPLSPVAPSSAAPTPTARSYDARSRDPNAVTGFISSIKYTTTQDEIREFLIGEGCRIDHIEMMLSDTRKFLGKAIVTFQDPESLNICLKLDGVNFNGMNINTKVYEIRNRPTSNRLDRDSRGNNSRPGDRDNRDRRPEGRFGGRDGGRDSGRGDRRGDRERPPRREMSSEKLDDAQEEGEKSPATRPKLVLQPRTLPVSTIGKPVVNPGIFGAGRPQDEREYEDKKKQGDKEGETPAVEATKADPVDSLAVNGLIIEVPADQESNAGEASTSDKRPPKSRSERSKKGGRGDGDRDGKSPHDRSGPKSNDRKKRVDKAESGSQDGDVKKHVFQGAERKAKKSPKDGKGKKIEIEAAAPAEPVDDFTVVGSNKQKDNNKAKAAKSAPSPASAAPTPTSASSKQAKVSNSYAGLLSDSDAEE